MKFLFSPYGRVSRKGIWLFYLLYLVLYLSAMGVDMTMGFYDAESEIGVFSGLMSLFLLWPSIAVPVKRFHDRNMTGWWYLILTVATLVAAVIGGVIAVMTSGVQLDAIDTMSEAEMFSSFLPAFIGIGIVCIYWFIVQMVLPGTRGDNKYGSDPLAK